MKRAEYTQIIDGLNAIIKEQEGEIWGYKYRIETLEKKLKEAETSKDGDK